MISLYKADSKMLSQNRLMTTQSRVTTLPTTTADATMLEMTTTLGRATALPCEAREARRLAELSLSPRTHTYTRNVFTSVLCDQWQLSDRDRTAAQRLVSRRDTG